MNGDDLKKIGVNYPIKLEYYKLISENDQRKYEENFGIEVMKTSYFHEEVKTENVILKDITKEETVINHILDILRENEVTPISTSYVVEDLLKEIG